VVYLHVESHWVVTWQSKRGKRRGRTKQRSEVTGSNEAVNYIHNRLYLLLIAADTFQHKAIFITLKGLLSHSCPICDWQMTSQIGSCLDVTGLAKQTSFGSRTIEGNNRLSCAHRLIPFPGTTYTFEFLYSTPEFIKSKNLSVLSNEHLIDRIRTALIKIKMFVLQTRKLLMVLLREPLQ
jgi:hypothetical protein